MNKFIYMPANDAVTIPTEMVINPLTQIESGYMPVILRFHFTANDVLIDTTPIEVPFVNQRACDLVGACLLFSKIAELVQICHLPYMKDGMIWVDVSVELTKMPLASGDLINMYVAHFNNSPSALMLKNLRKKE